jgi:hypothetical protein
MAALQSHYQYNQEVWVMVFNATFNNISVIGRDHMIDHYAISAYHH